MVQFFLSILIILLSDNAFANDAQDIMQQVMDRDNGEVEISRTRLSTCKIKKKGKKTICAEKPRIKIFEGIRKDFGKNGKDTKSIMIILNPPGERGVGFLQYDYEDEKKDTDQWIYLSAMNKIKRIISANEDEPKKGSFFGSEIGYEDMEQRKIEDAIYKLLKSEKYQKRDCWVIESYPTPERARKSNYSKSITWIDKERYLPLKTIMFDRRGRKEKRIISRKIEKIDNIWVARKSYFNNLLTNRMTTMTMESLAFNTPIADEVFTQRTLTDSAFREQNLTKLRSELK